MSFRNLGVNRFSGSVHADWSNTMRNLNLITLLGNHALSGTLPAGWSTLCANPNNASGTYLRVIDTLEIHETSRRGISMIDLADAKISGVIPTEWSAMNYPTGWMLVSALSLLPCDSCCPDAEPAAE